MTQRDRQESDLPIDLGKPALRALEAAGYRQIQQLTQLSEGELTQLHGVGPKVIDRLHRALGEQGLSFAGGESRKG